MLGMIKVCWIKNIQIGNDDVRENVCNAIYPSMDCYILETIN